MSKFTEREVVGLSEGGLGLDDLVRQGARQVIQQAIEAELSALLERFENVKTLHGQRAVVRNGYLPEREVLTAAGPIPVKVPKVRDRSGSGVKFNSSIVPLYVRKSPRVSAALPWLYLKGISTGDMSEALSVLLGEDAKGLSANVVSRLKAQWADEHVTWSRRDLSKSRWASGLRWKKCSLRHAASAAGFTRWATCSTRCRSRNRGVQRQTCRRSGWPRRAPRRTPRSIVS
jgi:putative transposase